MDFPRIAPDLATNVRPADTNEEHDLVARAHELGLVRRALTGSPDALLELKPYFAKVPAIVAVLRPTSPVPVLEQDLPDLIQDCLAVVWKKLPDYAGRAALTTWMFRVCQLELKNGFRRVARRRRDAQAAAGGTLDRVSSQDDPAQRLIDIDLSDCIARLDPLAARIIDLHHYADHTFDEIATVTELKTSQVKTHYYRALERLHDYLAARNYWSEGR